MREKSRSPGSELNSKLLLKLLIKQIFSFAEMEHFLQGRDYV